MKELSFKLPFCPFTFGFHFYPFASALPLLPSHFCPFVSNIFSLASSSFQAKKKKKTIEKKRNVEKGGNFPSSSHSAFSLLALASTLPLLPFCFKRFFLASSSFQVEEKEKKPHKKEKKCKERKELSFKLLLCPLTFGSHFYPFVSNVFSWHFLLLKQKGEKKTQRKKKP
jgi:hypothetical protein